MYGRRAENLHIINEFGAIGSAFPIAVGMAATQGDGKLLLIEGDGSLMMHIQELETIRRHGIRMLICTVNDGGYGAEVHKFRAQGYDAAESQHGRGDIAAIARGFGLRGEKITSLERFQSSFRGAREGGAAGAVGSARRRQDPVRALPAHPLRRSLSLRCGCRRRGNPSGPQDVNRDLRSGRWLRAIRTMIAMKRAMVSRYHAPENRIP